MPEYAVVKMWSVMAYDKQYAVVNRRSEVQANFATQKEALDCAALLNERWYADNPDIIGSIQKSKLD
jgi:hypothetical protein